jgi:DNA polymerase
MYAPRAHLDFETGSQLPLGNQKSVGVHRYALHPSTRIWMFRYKIGAGPIGEWRPGWPDPVDLLEHIARGGIVVAHNAAFERIIWNWLLRMRYCPHWPELRVEQQRCTMAKAFAYGYPGKLEVLGAAIGTREQKDMDGGSAMMRLSSPRRVMPDGSLLWWDETPGMVDRVSAYCAQDVRTEEEIDHFLPDQSEDEQALWIHDQVINDRGVMFDRAMAVKAMEMYDYAKKTADRRMRQWTQGAVRKVGQTEKIAEWLTARGVPADALRKEDAENLKQFAVIVEDQLAVDVLELRQEASKTSVKKYHRIVETMCGDDRVRGLAQYHGAHTGRWGGRLVQAQNFPRVDAETEGDIVEFVTSVMADPAFSAQEAVEAIELGAGPALKWMSKALRSCIIAAPRKKLVGGDYANIEGRGSAWIAGEEWKLDAFREYDAGTGPDLYRVSYARSFGIETASVTKAQRQIGKVQELALGYQGSVGAYINMGANYGVKVRPIADAVKASVSAEMWNATALRYKGARDKNGLVEHDWTGIKIIVTNWRTAHPATVQAWWDVQDAAIEAVDVPGHPVYVLNGRVGYLCDGGYLYCRLPSNRVIVYTQPHIADASEEMVQVDGEWMPVELYDEETLKLFDDLGCQFRKRPKRQLRYWGTHEGRWGVQHLYGGVQWNNIVQGTARDILKHGMRNVEAAGYPIIFHVHDEIVSEVDESFGSDAEFQRLMSKMEPWMHGLPLAAAAWEDRRYVK